MFVEFFFHHILEEVGLTTLRRDHVAPTRAVDVKMTNARRLHDGKHAVDLTHELILGNVFDAVIILVAKGSVVSLTDDLTIVGHLDTHVLVVRIQELGEVADTRIAQVLMLGQSLQDVLLIFVRVRDGKLRVGVTVVGLDDRAVDELDDVLTGPLTVEGESARGEKSCDANHGCLCSANEFREEDWTNFSNWNTKIQR